MKIQALSFDADQTLWDLTGVFRNALDAVVVAMVERGDVKSGTVTTDDLWDARAEVREHFRGQPHRMEDIRERSFALVLERQGHAAAGEAAAELIEMYLEMRFRNMKLFPDVESALSRLKPQYKLGLLTNGNTYPDQSGLPGVFDAEVFCSEHGVTKPDVRAFEIVAEQLGVSPQSMLHIGDDWDDIEGANAVGATSVFINRSASAPEWAAAADYEVTDLVGLEELLERLKDPSH